MGEREKLTLLMKTAATMANPKIKRRADIFYDVLFQQIFCLTIL